ncbi:MAG: ABZJ_00895 family protein [Pseudomonadota bacterium]
MLKQFSKNTRFALVFLLIAMAAAVLVLVVQLVFAVTVGGAVTFVVPMAAGMFAGQWEAQDRGAMPDGKFMWTESARYAGIGLLVSLLMSVLAVLSPQNQEMLSMLSIPVWIAILAFAYGIYVLAVRLGMGIGAKSVLNKG